MSSTMYSRIRRWFACSLALAAIACAHAQPSSSAEPDPMPADSASDAAGTAKVRGRGVALEAEFAYAGSKRVVTVSYRVHNLSAGPLAVFDRGDRHAVATGRQTAGAIAAPAWRIEGGDVSLSHAAAPLPNPAPVSPPTPLAIRVAAGAQTAGRFEFALPGLDAPKRLRWCLGVAAFEDRDFTAPESAGGVEVWRASFAVVERQQLVCTPWFDVAANGFAAR
ncbi:hypothetical protein [Lysobacter sp. 1R34A]|uniref:hypothetical protein n=1 Tax=Lysobacter sp. 1R34A TaxID=3445786 RepID=UPI003EEB73E3